MATVDITFNDQEVQRALNNLISRTEDTTDAMRQVADVLADATDNAFASESNPATGVAWAPLSPVTVALRPKGKRGSPILNLHGASGLLGSIATDYGKNFAEIGSNRVYAPTHQFGAEKGEFGSFSLLGTRQVIPLPWGDIPARPFLGIGPADEKDILEIASRFLASAFE